ncbi:superantigen-like protein SSL4 [Archangium violaceum]|uniref:hypothetical protein n=1 Tax=Archangium violaceum TaxID=83451 RepID=UPI0036D949BB
MKRTRIGVGILLCTGLVGLLWRLMPGQTPPAGQMAAETRPEAKTSKPPAFSLRRASPQPRVDPPPGTTDGAPSQTPQTSSTPGSSNATPAELALIRATHQFQFESQPALDGCLGQALHGPRVPQPVKILFKREAQRTDFIASRIEPLPGGSPQSNQALSRQVSSCLEGLQGRPLPLRTALPDEQREVLQVVTLLVPSEAPPTSTH